MCLGIWLSMGERTILEWNEDKSPYAETRGKCLLVRKRRRYRISKMMNTGLDWQVKAYNSNCVVPPSLNHNSVKKTHVIIMWID